MQTLSADRDSVPLRPWSGMSTREIQGHLEEIYGAEVSPTLISNVTEAVLEEVSRPLEELYPILYLDALMVKIRDNGHIRNKAIHVAVGVNLEGNKEVLGGPVGLTERRRQILAAGAHRITGPRCEGHPHRLRGLAERRFRTDAARGRWSGCGGARDGRLGCSAGNRATEASWTARKGTMPPGTRRKKHSMEGPNVPNRLYLSHHGHNRIGS